MQTFREYYEANYTPSIIDMIRAFHNYIFKDPLDLNVNLFNSIYDDLRTDQERDLFSWFLLVGFSAQEDGFRWDNAQKIVERFNRSIKDFPDGINESLSLSNPVDTFEWFAQDGDEEIERALNEMIQ